MATVTRTNEGLAIVIGSGWITFYQLRQLETTCLYVCRESRRQVARTVRATMETPCILWRRAQESSTVSGNEDARTVSGNADYKTVSGGGGSRKGPATLLNLSDEREDVSWYYARNKMARRTGGGDGRPGHGGATSEEESRRESGRSGDRVPLVRTAGINWTLPVAELLSRDFRLPEGVKEFNFWGKFEDSVEEVDFPDTLEGLSFGFRFDRSLGPGCIRWPPRLKRLRFGAKWNQDLWEAKESWPASLEELHLGTGFDKPLTGFRIGLPPGLKEISLGGVFDQPVRGVEWPVSLQKLTFSDSFNQELEGTSFPPGLREIHLGASFDQGFVGVVWPEGLETLTFGLSFDQPFISRDDVSLGGTLPPGLKILVLGEDFDQPMSESELPEGLEQLVIGRRFSFMKSVRWPSGLKNLCLACEWGTPPPSSGKIALPANLEVLRVGQEFNCSLKHVAFPRTLKKLILGSTFDQRIGEENGKGSFLPEGLEEVRFGAAFNRVLDDAQLPRGLKRVIFAADCKFNRSVDRVSWPPGLEELRFGNCFDQSLEGSSLPGSLKVLEFGWSFSYSLQGVVLPEGLSELHVSITYPPWHLKGLEWPRSLRTVHVGTSHFRTRESLVKWAIISLSQLD